jgi:PKD repeat protein
MLNAKYLFSGVRIATHAIRIIKVVGICALILIAYIMAAVTNSDILIYKRSVAVEPPTAVITLPKDESVHYTDEYIQFDGSDSTPSYGLTYLWESDLEGVLSTSKKFTKVLSEGTHIITLTVENSAGTDTASVTIFVEVKNHPPTIEVTSPAGGEEADESFEIRWVGTDPDLGDVLYVDIYYDTDLDPMGLYEIVLHLPNDPQSYVWDTSQVMEGYYYIYMVIWDPQELYASDYSDGTVRVNHNQPPKAPGGDMEDIQPDKTHSLTPTIYWESSTDPDSDPITYHINIGTTEHGTEIVNDAQTTVPEYAISVELSYGPSGTNIYYIDIYAEDDKGAKSPTISDILVVENHAPADLVVEITPSTPRTTDNLVCEILQDAEDIDGDPVTYRYEWYKKSGADPYMLKSELTTDTVPAEYTSKGQSWKCVVTPSDGFTDGEPSEATVVIENSLPVAVITAPEDGKIYYTTKLTLDASGTWDDDGDELTYKWKTGTKELGDTQVCTAVLSPGTYTIILTVNDGDASVCAKVTITIKSETVLDTTTDTTTDDTSMAEPSDSGEPDVDQRYPYEGEAVADSRLTFMQLIIIIVILIALGVTLLVIYDLKTHRVRTALGLTKGFKCTMCGAMVDSRTRRCEFCGAEYEDEQKTTRKYEAIPKTYKLPQPPQPQTRYHTLVYEPDTYTPTYTIERYKYRDKRRS